jgi:hypothetical protein
MGRGKDTSVEIKVSKAAQMLSSRGKGKMMECGGLERRSVSAPWRSRAVLMTQGGPHCEAQIQPSRTPKPKPDTSRTPERNLRSGSKEDQRSFDGLHVSLVKAAAA